MLHFTNSTPCGYVDDVQSYTFRGVFAGHWLPPDQTMNSPPGACIAQNVTCKMGLIPMFPGTRCDSCRCQSRWKPRLVTGAAQVTGDTQYMVKGNVPTVEACASLCASNATCIWYNWRSEELVGEVAGRCQLVVQRADAAATRVSMAPRSSLLSGPTLAFQSAPPVPHLRLPPSPNETRLVSSYAQGAESPGACAASCIVDGRCKSWTWDNSSRWLAACRLRAVPMSWEPVGCVAQALSTSAPTYLAGVMYSGCAILPVGGPGQEAFFPLTLLQCFKMCELNSWNSSSGAQCRAVTFVNYSSTQGTCYVLYGDQVQPLDPVQKSNVTAYVPARETPTQRPNFVIGQPPHGLQATGYMGAYNNSPTLYAIPFQEWMTPSICGSWCRWPCQVAVLLYGKECQLKTGVKDVLGDMTRCPSSDGCAIAVPDWQPCGSGPEVKCASGNATAGRVARPSR